MKYELATWVPQLQNHPKLQSYLVLTTMLSLILDSQQVLTKTVTYEAKVQYSNTEEGDIHYFDEDAAVAL